MGEMGRKEGLFLLYGPGIMFFSTDPDPGRFPFFGLRRSSAALSSLGFPGKQSQ
jgi:hypothetical protein